MSNAPNYQLDLLAERMRSVRPGRSAPALKLTPPPAKVYSLLTLEEAAEECRVSLPTFRKWPVKQFVEGGVVRIRRQDLEEFIASRIVAAHDAPRSTTGEDHGQHRQ